MSDQGLARRWWGEQRVAHGATARWRIGPLELWVQRLRGEWRVAHRSGADPFDSTTEIELPAAIDDFLALDNVERFGVSLDEEVLRLEPLLADRAVVARPEKPFHVPPGEAVTAYVGSPLWVRLSAAPGLRLRELPVFRLSDTWFGPTTLEGELCYASRTLWRLRPDEVPLRPHRALTAVRIENRAESPLSIERLKLPAPHLALYQTAEGALRTQDVRYVRSEGGDFAALRLRDEPPSGAADAVRLAPSREQRQELGVVRAFQSLFE